MMVDTGWGTFWKIATQANVAERQSKAIVMYRCNSAFTNPIKPSITSLSACEHTMDIQELGLHLLFQPFYHRVQQ